RASFDPGFCLRLARGLVASKLRNSRTLLRRNWRGEPLGYAGEEPSGESPRAPDAVLGGLQRSARAAAEAKDLGELLGIAGNGGALYFGGFGATLRKGAGRGRRLRLSQPQPPSADRSGQCAVVISLCNARARAQRDPLGGRFRPLSWLLSSAALR